MGGDGFVRFPTGAFLHSLDFRSAETLPRDGLGVLASGFGRALVFVCLAVHLLFFPYVEEVATRKRRQRGTGANGRGAVLV